jgi:hypothetical protein
VKSFCPYCGLIHLSDPPDDHVCPCGVAWRDLAPFPRSELTVDEWVIITHSLMVRSQGRCEIGSPECRAPAGDLTRLLNKGMVSRHHRSARQMGGTANPAIHSLANLMLVCGHGTDGCHGWIEEHARGDAPSEEMYQRGLLIRHSVPGKWTADTDPSRVPVTLGGGRRVLLHPTNPEYIPYLRPVAPPSGVTARTPVAVAAAAGVLSPSDRVIYEALLVKNVAQREQVESVRAALAAAGVAGDVVRGPVGRGAGVWLDLSTATALLERLTSS